MCCVFLSQAKPSRLHCSHCDETYSLPQNGAIKLYKELRCPLDEFELVLWTSGSRGKSYSLCPYCFSNPPFRDMKKGNGESQIQNIYTTIILKPDAKSGTYLNYLKSVLDCCANSSLLSEEHRGHISSKETDRQGHGFTGTYGHRGHTSSARNDRL